MTGTCPTCHQDVVMLMEPRFVEHRGYVVLTSLSDESLDRHADCIAAL